MKKHVNIPVFIPHLGCPNQCVFCNQRYISSVTEFDISKVRTIIESALATIDPSTTETEIAFFGGSFTGIDRSLMIDLLNIAEEYVSQGAVSCIRLSTRPDYIDEERLRILSAYHVRTIELGIQSASDHVLSLSKRGHSAEVSRNAARLVRDAGFDLVGQMMIGLPGATLEDEIATAKMIAECKASSARIYPAIVFKNTELDCMHRDGIYTPLSIDEAVFRSKEVYRLFLREGVEVIRIGLCSSENLSSKETYSAGPNHVAIGELVESAIYFDLVSADLNGKTTEGRVLRVCVNDRDVSKAAGQNRANKLALASNYRLKCVKIIGDPDLPKYKVKISLV